MIQQITCINCPVGCRMAVTIDDQTKEVQTIEGNTCPRGITYARQECTLPLRMVTAVVPVLGSTTPLSVKTAAPIPKHLIPDVMAVLRSLTVSGPVSIGQVVLPNVCGTSVNIIATRHLS